jgi:hypothetical protein
MILDEAQAIKNVHSQRWKVRSLWNLMVTSDFTWI